MEQDNITVKECSRCHRTLAVTDFYKKSTSPDGLQYVCKQCQNELSKNHQRKKKAFGGGESRTLTLHATPANGGAEGPWLYGRTQIHTDNKH